MAHADRGIRLDSDEMSAAIKQTMHVDLLDAFYERCEARALLWSLGEIELAEAVDELQAAAVRDGLVERLGQDGVQLAMALAFAKYPEPS